MNTVTILLVDDAEDTLDVLGRHLKSHGYGVATALGAKPALERLAAEHFDLVVADVKMPGLSGMELLRIVRERFTDTEVVLITGYATIQGAVDAVKTGAAEYLAKPFTKDELIAAVERALRHQAESRKARDGAPAAHRFGLVGRSQVFRTALDLLEQAVRDAKPVHLLGERGTGRKAAALGVTGALRGAEAPVGLASCGRLSNASLLRRAAGAEGGALIAVDVDEATAEQQADLFRITKMDLRLFLIGTPRFAEQAEAIGFHAELREACAAVVLPPLRDRQGDVRLLTAHFAQVPQRAAVGFSEEALQALDAYAWPGNVAELKEAVLSLSGARDGRTPVGLRDLPEVVRAHFAPSGRSLEEIEGEHILRVLARVGGNKSRASEILGINRKTLGEKLKSLEIPRRHRA